MGFIPILDEWLKIIDEGFQIRKHRFKTDI